jgi:phage portal protein BeeE
VRLLDRLIHTRDYWEGMASGAAVLTQTYGSPDKEAILPQVAAWTQQANGTDAVVFAGIMARMVLFAEAQFQFQRKSDRELFGNTSLALLEHPWENGTTGELLARALQDADLAGQFYVWAPPGEDMLVRLRPDWTTIISELVRVPGGGTYRRKVGYWVEPPKSAIGQGEGEFYPAAEVAHWAPIPDPQATFRGMSPLTPVYRDINADSGMVSFKVKYMENAATPNMILRYPVKLHPGTIDSVRERMAARYGGVDNAFKTLVLDQGADLTVVGSNLEQLDFANVAQAGAERILSALGVPPLLVGLETIKGAGKSYEEVIRRFADLTMRPLWRSACGALEAIVPGGVPSGVRLWVDTGDIAALQEGEQVRAQVTLIRAQALLALQQAGYTADSAVTAIEAGDMSQLVANPAAVAPPAGNVQHLLPQAQPGVTAKPLPAGSSPRLPVGPASPGDGSQNTTPVRRPAAARRMAELNGHEI